MRNRPKRAPAPQPDPLPEECSRHLAWGERAFVDAPYTVELPRPTDHSDDGEGDGDRRFSCRVRRWDFDAADDAKPNLLLVSGIGHNCNYYDPLVACLGRDDALSAAVARVYALDLPGHGASETPGHVKFGQLTLAHYVETIRQVLAALCAEVGRVDCVAGHSMGGMLVMLLEQTLSDRGRTMRGEFGTTGAVLLAPALPEGIRWPLVEGRFKRGVSKDVILMLAPYLTYSLRYGPHVRCSNEDFVRQFFSVAVAGGDGREALAVVSNAPEGDEVSVLNDPESYAAMSELAGLDLEWRGTVKRPRIDAGLFEGYVLGVVSYSKDMLIPPEGVVDLCAHLSPKTIYEPVEHAEACHDDTYSCPCLSLEVFREVLGAAAG